MNASGRPSPVRRLLAAEFRLQRPRLVAAAVTGGLVSTASVALLGLSGWFITAAALAGLAGLAGAAVAHAFNYLLPSAFIRLLAIVRTAARYGERVTGHEAGLRGLAALRPRLVAMTAGGIMGTMCLIGLSLLLHRRLTNPRIRAVTSLGDKVLMIWILLTLLLGLTTIIVSAGHMDGAEMVRLMTWAQHIVTFQSDAASLIADVSIIFKLHMFMGMTLFILFPFTRLVHVWSGFASLTYLGRAWQLVRQR